MLDVGVGVIGGGPVGLWLAAELRLGGVSVAVFEQDDAPSQYSRGLGVHARTLEVFAMREIVNDHLAGGRRIPGIHFGMLSHWVDLSGLDSRFPFMLAITQRQTVVLLENYARSLGADVRRQHRCVGRRESAEHIELDVEGPEGRYQVCAQYVVGCDGADSMVRKSTGIEFVGHASTKTNIFADVELAEPPTHPISYNGENGSFMCVPMPDSRWRLTTFDPDRLHVSRDVPVTLEELSESARRIVGTDYGAHSPHWMVRIGNAALQAAEYRRSRTFLAGDAAHVFPPQGGQGLNLGVQDAMNLGWKLAAAIKGWAPPWLLDSYHSERHPVGARILQLAQAQCGHACPLTSEQHAIRDFVDELISDLPSVNETLARRVSGLDIAYAPRDADAHPLVGRRVPDLALVGARESSVFPLLSDGRFLFLVLDKEAPLPLLNGFDDHVATIRADALEKPADWPEISAVLVRPDGYVAWASEERDFSRLAQAASGALADWCSATTDVVLQ